jgi:FAD synthetase
MYKPIREIQPDIITLGWNQHFDPELLMQELEKKHIAAKVVRISGYSNSPYTSSRQIVKEIVNRAQTRDQNTLKSKETTSDA